MKELVDLALSFKDTQLHKWLVLSQTRYVCRNGTLSDGHDKITPSQRYSQAIKEMYFIARSILLEEALEKEAKAELLQVDREASMNGNLDEVCLLKRQARAIRAELKLSEAKVNMSDKLRMLDEYNKVRLELEPEVVAKYPEGIEQAEEDNWKAIAKLKNIRSQTPGLGREMMTNVPLPQDEKFKLGLEYERPDMMAPLIVSDERKALQLGGSKLWQKNSGSPLEVAQQKQILG